MKDNKAPDKLFWRYKPSKADKADWSAYGVYGIVAHNAADFYSNMSKAIFGKVDKTVKGGFPGKVKTKEVDMTTKERQYLLLASIIDGLGLIGISDAALLTINNKFKSNMDRHLKETYQGKEFTIQAKGKPGKKWK